MPTLPTPDRGTEQRKLATIVFTDMVGSTQLKQELGDRTALALIQRHHTLVRHTLIRFANAEEISTAGDSFFMAFENPSDAVRFALVLGAELRALTREAGRAVSDRIGIHVGEVFIEEGVAPGKPKDLHGIQVDTCSRLMGLANAGQILMTCLVFDNARQVLRGGDIEGVGALSWLNHGPYLLKGVEEPLEVCEVGELGQGVLAPPTSSEKARRHISDEGEPVLGWRPALEQKVPGTEWVLEKKLGEGGFGEVWLGRHEKLKERRVFKFCFRADRVRSLKREVTLFRLLKEKVGQHPNIVGIREVFFDEPPSYIVMDYAEAADLRAWSEEQGGVDKVPLATRLEIVAQVADALQAAHEAGVIHRDVKPSNVLVHSESGSPGNEAHSSRSPAQSGPSPVGCQQVQAKLTDFGIGQVVSQEALAGLTRLGFTETMLSPGSSSQTGTHLYMAPELLAGKSASTRSDIFSLGVVLYQLLIGDLARPLTTDWHRRITDPLLREDLEKCFAGDPEERFVQAGELASNLRKLERRRAEAEARQHAARRRQQARKTLAVTAALLIFTALLGLVWKLTKGAATTAPPAIKIAVIPFHNESTDPDDVYLGDALTAEIIRGIRKVPGLNAIRPHARMLAGSAEETRTILASVGGVPFLLEGTVRRSGGVVRVSARLIDTTRRAATALPLFDSGQQDLFGVPNQLTLRIAERSGVSLPRSVRARIAKNPTTNPQAYDCYLRGRFDLQGLALRASQGQGPKSAIPMLERAVQLDPRFGVAHAELARAYTRDYFYYHPERTAELEGKAQHELKLAFQLDGKLPEAHFAAGFLSWAPSQHWNCQKAIEEYSWVLDRSPYEDETLDQLTLIYLHLGLLDEARDLVAEALKNNPLNPLTKALDANALFWQGKDSEAAETWRSLSEADTLNFIIRSYHVVALINLNRTNEATNLIARALAADPTDKGGLFASTQAMLAAKRGHETEATNRIARVLDQGKGFGHFHHALYNVACAYALLNKPDLAVDALRKAADDGLPCYPFFLVDTNLYNLRTNAAFKSFLTDQKKSYASFTNEFRRK